ncbi:hypothetical protein J6A31_08900 [bacterium]|nr:hypothetical protein [bacterium]
MILYHGTNFEAAQDIIKNGFCSKNLIWSCSDENMTYLVHDKHECALNFAIEAGQIAAAHNGSNSTSVAVFRITLDEDEVLPDISCPNMDDCYQIDSSDLNELIENKKATLELRVVENAYNPHFRPFYLPSYNNFYNIPDDGMLIAAVDIIRKSNSAYCICDYIYDSHSYTDDYNDLKALA